MRQPFFLNSQVAPTAPLQAHRTLSAEPNTRRSMQMFDHTMKSLLAVAGIAGAALGGAAIAGAASSSSGAGTNATTTQSRPAMPAHGTASHEDAEKPVTGDAATKAKA